MSGRSRRSSALVFVVVLASVPVQAQSHVRATFRRAASAVDRGQRRSATFKALIETIDRSDLIVHIVDGTCADPRARACTTFIQAGGGVRYVRVTIAAFLPADGIIVLLAHELQHVAEIASAPAIVDDRAMRAFFDAHGWPFGSTGFETPAASDMSARVARELALGRGK